MSPILQLPLLDLAEIPAPSCRQLVWAGDALWGISFNQHAGNQPGLLVRFNQPLTTLHDFTLIPLPPEQHGAVDLLLGLNGKLYLSCMAARTRGGSIIVEVDPITLAQRVAFDSVDFPNAGAGPSICLGGGFGWAVNYGPGEGNPADPNTGQPAESSWLMKFTEDFSTLLGTMELVQLSRGNAIAYDPVTQQLVGSAIINSKPGVCFRVDPVALTYRTVTLNPDELVPCYNFALGADGSMLTACETSAALIRVAPDMTISRIATCLPGNVAVWRVDSDGASLWMSTPLGPGSPSFLQQVDPVSLAMRLWLVSPPVGSTMRAGNPQAFAAKDGMMLVSFQGSGGKYCIGRAALPGVPT